MGIVPLSSQPVAAEVIPTNVRASPRRRLPIEAIQAWLFLLPAVVILGVFQIFPAIAALYMSLFKWDVVQGAFRGLGNYTDWLYDNAIRSPDFWRSLSTTFTYVIFTVPLEIALALVRAVEARRLVELLRNVRKPGEEDHDLVAEVMPDRHERDHDEREARAGEPRG